MKEIELQTQIRLALSDIPRSVFWRNNVGLARHQGRMVAYGVGGKGGSDLLGIINGRFVALEVKLPGCSPSSDQRLFLELVEKKGGFARVAHSPDEALAYAETCLSFTQSLKSLSGGGL